MHFVHTLSVIPGWGGHRPNPFQVAPEASRIGCEGVSWPGVPPGVIMSRTLEHQMLDRLVGAVAVRADGRVPAPDTVKVSRHQWGMALDHVFPILDISIRSGDIRDRTLKWSEIEPNLARFWSQTFFGGRAPRFWDRDYKTEQLTKFRGDRPTELGDLALKRKERNISSKT